MVIFVWQGRQKLAKFNKREFATLIIDILNDAKRRYGTATASPTHNAVGQPQGNIIVFLSFLITPFFPCSSWISLGSPIDYHTVAGIRFLIGQIFLHLTVSEYYT